MEENEMENKVATLGHILNNSAWFKLNQEERINMIKIKIKTKWVDNWNFAIDSDNGKHLNVLIGSFKSFRLHHNNKIINGAIKRIRTGHSGLDECLLQTYAANATSQNH